MHAESPARRAAGSGMTVTTRAHRGRDTAPAGGGRRPQRHRLTTSAQRLAAEIVGTFFLVLAAAGGDIIAELHPGQVSPAARAIAPALVVMAMIYVLGSVSGADLNPVVTFAFAVRRVLPWRWVVPYVAAELTGAIVAAATLRLLFSPVGRTGLSYPRGSVAESFGLEVILTLLLVVVILSVVNRTPLARPGRGAPDGRDDRGGRAGRPLRLRRVDEPRPLPGSSHRGRHRHQSVDLCGRSPPRRRARRGRDDALPGCAEGRGARRCRRRRQPLTVRRSVVHAHQGDQLVVEIDE